MEILNVFCHIAIIGLCRVKCNLLRTHVTLHCHKVIQKTDIPNITIIHLSSKLIFLWCVIYADHLQILHWNCIIIVFCGEISTKMVVPLQPFLAILIAIAIFYFIPVILYFAF